MKIALLGKTGVGKSTLINAVVGAPVAATGVGLPVTSKPATYYFSDGHALYDGAGIELGSSVPDLMETAKRTLKDADVAWWCIRASDRRFESAEATVIQAIINAGTPVDVVITQTPLVEGEWPETVDKLVEEILKMGLSIEYEPIPIMACENRAMSWPAFGLECLLGIALERGSPRVATAKRRELLGRITTTHRNLRAPARSRFLEDGEILLTLEDAELFYPFDEPDFLSFDDFRAQELAADSENTDEPPHAAHAAGGGVGGAILGGFIGSLFGPLGTAIGASIGGGIGAGAAGSAVPDPIGALAADSEVIVTNHRVLLGSDEGGFSYCWFANPMNVFRFGNMCKLVFSCHEFTYVATFGTLGAMDRTWDTLRHHRAASKAPGNRLHFG